MLARKLTICDSGVTKNVKNIPIAIGSEVCMIGVYSGSCRMTVKQDEHNVIPALLRQQAGIEPAEMQLLTFSCYL